MRRIYVLLLICAAALAAGACHRDIPEYSLVVLDGISSGAGSSGTTLSLAGEVLEIDGEIVLAPAVDGISADLNNGYSTFKVTVLGGGELVELSTTEAGYCHIVPAANGDVRLNIEYFDGHGYQRIREVLTLVVRMNFVTLGFDSGAVSSALYHDTEAERYNFVFADYRAELVPGYVLGEDEFIFSLIIPDFIMGSTLEFGKDNFSGFSITEADYDGTSSTVGADYFTGGTFRANYDAETGLFTIDMDGLYVDEYDGKTKDRHATLKVSAYPLVLDGYIWPVPDLAAVPANAPLRFQSLLRVD